MANTFSQIYIQVVFAVQDRQNIIKTQWKEELYKYTAGIVTNHGQKLISIGGVGDHVHILLGIKPSISVSDLVREIKANSSRFINERRFVRGKFNWQEGFGAFSYSRSQIDAVVRYIENQEKHHSEKTFKQEYLNLLAHFEIEFEDRYLFDWIE